MGLNFFLSQIQCGLLDAYPAPILTMFETTDVSWCPGVYTHEKFPNFCVGVCKTQKLPPEAVFWWGAGYQRTARTAKFWVIEIIQGLVDIPRCAICM